MRVPAVFPLVVYRGDTARWAFALYDDTAQTEPTDLTGVTPRSQIRDYPGGHLIAEVRCSIDECSKNQINAVLRYQESRNLPMSAFWDLGLRYLSGEWRTILRGPVSVTPRVTTLDENWWRWNLHTPQGWRNPL